MKRQLVLLIAGFIALAPLSAADRVALVVGCANYKAEPAMTLDTPLNDMNDLAVVLESPALGFQVWDATSAIPGGADPVGTLGVYRVARGIVEVLCQELPVSDAELVHGGVRG